MVYSIIFILAFIKFPSKTNALSVLTLPPATFLTLIFVLSTKDKEVLVYMVTRLMNSDNSSLSSSAEEKNKKGSIPIERYGNQIWFSIGIRISSVDLVHSENLGSSRVIHAYFLL